MKRFFLFSLTHVLALAIGFVAGVYTLPILTAASAPSAEMIASKKDEALFSAEFTKDLRGSDFLHWGEGTISLSKDQIIYDGKLAPGPDYKLYLVKEFVEHEDEFLPLKNEAQVIGDVKSFNGFVLDIPQGVNIKEYNTVIVWCEAFSEFITSVKYQ